MTRALDGVRIVEFAGLGPAPFCGMMLADQGAEVILVERPVHRRYGNRAFDILNRSPLSLAREDRCQS